MGPYYRKLKRKMMVSILCFSLIPLLVLAGTIYYQFSVAYTGKTIEALRTLARNRCRAVEMFLQERTAQVITLTKTHSIEQLEDQAYLDDLFKVMQSTSKNFIDVEVMNEQGKHLAYVGPYRDELQPSNCLDENWFRLLLASGFYISDVCLGFREVPHFTIAVITGDGQKVRILRTAINSQILDGMIRQGQSGLRGDAFIINTKNELQTESRLSGSLMDQPKCPDFSSSVGTAVRDIQFDGVRTFFATSQMVNPRWVVVVRQVFGEELQPLFMARYVGLGILTIAILL
ncbi:MAG: cache domain-containing protein, partial [Desulfomonilaceae bacterium]